MEFALEYKVKQSKNGKFPSHYKLAQSILKRKFPSVHTVFIRLTALGTYKIFGPREWALIQGGRLFEAGCLLNFHHFQQV